MVNANLVNMLVRVPINTKLKLLPKLASTDELEDDDGIILLTDYDVHELKFSYGGKAYCLLLVDKGDEKTL